MTGSLQRLLEGVIDYAGLFPPAKLSMPEAVENYLRYRTGPESWIVDRFVCPAARLDEFRETIANRQVAETIPLAVVGTSGRDWGDGLVADADHMTRFIERSGELADIEVYEVRIPDHRLIAECLADLRSFNQVDVFCELPWGPGMKDSLGLIAEQEWIGAKARTGGMEASAFPSCDELAAFVQQCVQMEIQFKLTAGLHHPLRGDRAEVGTKMHGFLNALVATAMIGAHDLTTKEAARILEIEESRDFAFESQKVRTGDWSATLENIDEARSLFVGIGSCSVEEPIQDLKELKLI